MKNLILITALVICSVTGLNAQQVKLSEADQAWETMQNKIRKVSMNIDGKDKVKGEIDGEKFRRLLISERFIFWKRFPKDKRAIEWIVNGMDWSSIPRFWKNIEEGAKASAEAIGGFYAAQIDNNLFVDFKKEHEMVRKVVMTDASISEEDKQKFRQNELGLEMYRNSNSIYRGEKQEFLNRVRKTMEYAYAHLKPGDNYYRVYSQVERLFFQRNFYGLETEDLEKFARYFKGSKHREIQQWAMQKLSVFALEREPFEMKHQAIDGQEIDVAKLRGKVVLVDFWSNTCKVCIERMPAIKEVYDKYKDKGFVVISAANNPNIDKDLIIKIHHKIGADWPVLMIGGDSNNSGIVAPGSIGDQIFKKYGFTFVPQLLLLDKEGKLAMYNGVLMNGDFEPMVQDLLAK